MSTALWLGTLALMLFGLTFVFIAAHALDLLTTWEEKKQWLADLF